MFLPDGLSFVVDRLVNKVASRVHDPGASMHGSSSASIADRTIIQPVE